MKKNNTSNIIKLPTGFTGAGGQQLSRDEVRSRKKKRLPEMGDSTLEPFRFHNKR